MKKWPEISCNGENVEESEINQLIWQWHGENGENIE
jgi:hypothetical protein